MAAFPEALFTDLGGGRHQATEASRGPWDARALHGGPVAALVARALEGALADAAGPDDPAFVPVRLALELERPVGLDPLEVRAEVTRPGRSVRSADATLLDGDGRRLARATLVAIRQRAEPLDLGAAVLPSDEAPAPPGPPAAPSWETYPGPAFHRDAVEHRFVRGSFDEIGPTTDWIRLLLPVVAGEDPTPLQRVAAAADFGNGVSAAVDHATHTFINPDLVITLLRVPEGTHVGLEAVTRIDAGGVGLAESTLWDARGRVGVASQTLVVDAR
ncbi:thioesterase family protein [Iamia majanohamensis]|uniref:Thioesterase family protein n=1 Tax=Iamia majanohamensis TaxID=467976 RepID=A0AAE9YEX5_9ACTN|nr:thioesterase family protein [Iamia majanohamensis]WCO66596.1 thioesterase family protein [Iamia majanohamensis]